MKIFGAIVTFICLWFIIIFVGTIFIFGVDTCSKNLMELVKSPNGEYTIKTYLRNCGATVDFEIIADLCDKNDKCKKIYSGYHESVSFVYWINNENVFINQKTLNIHTDKYSGYDYDKAFRLYSIDAYKSMFLINKDKYEYKLDGMEANYINEEATSIFIFNKNNSYNDYDFTFKIVDFGKNTVNDYYLKIDNNKMYLIDGDKMSELNRTDYEYIKKIMITNKLYDFS
ncbi:MAG: hypothetical protein KH135_03410 [Firmicutes bacterium]|nr:hypothetical protein [Bacillota bacterium]